MRRHIGKMTSRLELYEPARTPDGAGGFIRGDGKVADIWGEIKAASSGERNQQMKLTEVKTHKVGIRWDERVRQGQYFIYDGRLFYIVSVNRVDERPRFMELSVREDGLV